MMLCSDDWVYPWLQAMLGRTSRPSAASDAANFIEPPPWCGRPRAFGRLGPGQALQPQNPDVPIVPKRFIEPSYDSRRELPLDAANPPQITRFAIWDRPQRTN